MMGNTSDCIETENEPIKLITLLNLGIVHAVKMVATTINVLRIHLTALNLCSTWKKSSHVKLTGFSWIKYAQKTCEVNNICMANFNHESLKFLRTLGWIQ